MSVRLIETSQPQTGSTANPFAGARDNECATVCVKFSDEQPAETHQVVGPLAALAALAGGTWYRGRAPRSFCLHLGLIAWCRRITGYLGSFNCYLRG